MPDLPTTLAGWSVYVAGKIGVEASGDPRAWLLLHRDQAEKCLTGIHYAGLLGALADDAISKLDRRVLGEDPYAGLGLPCGLYPIDRVQTPFRVRHPKVASFDHGQFDHDRAPLMLELEAKMMDTVREAQAGLAARLAEHPLPPGWDWQFDIASWDINEPARLVMTATPCIITREAFDQAVRIWGPQEAYGHAARGLIRIEDD